MIGLLLFIICTYRSIHGASAEDNRLWEHGGRLRHGGEVPHRPGSYGRRFHRRWPSWYPPPCRHCAGNLIKL